MWHRTFPTFCVILISFAMTSSAYNYQIFFKDERIFTKCEDHPDKFLNSVTNFDDLVAETFDNDTIHIYGDFKLLTKYPKQLKSSANVYKRHNGQWVDTIYSINRNDICTSLFISRTEFWSGYSQQLPPEKRKCPLPDGFSVPVDVMSDLVLNNIPDKKAEGEYKVLIKLFLDNENDLLVCCNIYMDLIRI